MFRNSAIVKELDISGKYIVIIGTGGIGFNVAKILIEDGFALKKLVCIDPDVADAPTLYKYGYGPEVVDNMPKVKILENMARRRYIIENPDDPDAQVSFEVLRKNNYLALPFSRELAEGLGSTLQHAIVFDCVDSSMVSNMIFHYMEEQGKEDNYISAKFDGDVLSIGKMPEGDYDGYAVGSSAYASQKAALVALEYAAAMVSDRDIEASYTMDLNDIGPALKELDTREKNIIYPYEALHIMQHYYAQAIKEAENWYKGLYHKNEPKRRNYYTYIAEGNVYYQSLNKKLKNGIFVSGFHIGDKDSSDRKKEVLDFYRGIKTWRFHYKGIDIVLPLVEDSSMTSLIPPLPEIEGLDKEYIKTIYALFLKSNAELFSPYIHPYMTYLHLVHVNHGISLSELFNELRSLMEKKTEHLDEVELRDMSTMMDNLEAHNKLIPLLAYIRAADYKAYLTLIPQLVQAKVLINMPEDDFFLYYYKDHALQQYRDYKGISYTITASGSSYISERNNMVYDIYDNLVYGMPVMFFTISGHLAQSKRLTNLGGNLVILAGGVYDIRIPEPTMLELDQKYYHDNKFVSTSAASLYNIASIYHLVQYAMALSYDIKRRKNELDKN